MATVLALRRVAWPLAIALPAALGACSSGDTSPSTTSTGLSSARTAASSTATGPPSATAVEFSSWGRSTSSCPAPRRADPKNLPSSLRDPANGGEARRWIHHRGLWSNPPSAVRVAGNRVKFGTVTVDADGASTRTAGKPRVTAERVDDGDVRVTASVGGLADAPGEVPRHFWPTTMDFPTAGCWRVTSRTSQSVLTFHIDVKP